MDNCTIAPHSIPVQQLISLKNRKVQSIEGLNIPNITIPPCLVTKKRITEAVDSLSINIRQLFNSITSENISIVKEQLRNIIVAKAQNAETIEEIAQEILLNFIISEQNIKNYIHLLNSVSSACVLLSTNKNIAPNDKSNVSPTIGNIFLKKCREMIFDCIDVANIRKLAVMDQDDEDQLDIYNRGREKIINLITTICCLYEQRSTANIKLTATQLFCLINTILTHHKNTQSKMNELGNPYEINDCKDEIEYEILRKMNILYAEQLYTFMYREAKEFNKDPELVKGQCLKIVVNRFKKEIIPTLTEAYLVSKCDSIEY